LVEAEKAFFQDGAGGFAGGEELGEILGEGGAVVGGGVEADEFREGGLVERINGDGAGEDAAGGGNGVEETELLGEEEGVGGAETGGVEEGVEHKLGAFGVAEAEKGEGAEAVEGAGEEGIVFVFLAEGGFGSSKGGAVIGGGDLGLGEGEVEGVGEILALAGKFQRALDERGLGGIAAKPREEHEGLGVGGEVGEESVDLAGEGFGGRGGTGGVKDVDAGAGADGVVEAAEEGGLAGGVGAALFAVVADEGDVEFVAAGEAGEVVLQAEEGEFGVAAFPIAAREQDIAFEGAF
jgi:hypothetical protein